MHLEKANFTTWCRKKSIPHQPLRVTKDITLVTCEACINEYNRQT